MRRLVIAREPWMNPRYASLWPAISAPRFGPDPDPNAAGAGGAPVDLSNPLIQAAIGAAVQRQTTELSAEVGRLKSHAQTVLDEKKQWDGLTKAGLTPQQVAERLKAFDELETKQKAGALGVAPEKYQADVEQAAQAKYKAKEDELSGVMSTQKTEIEKLTTQLEGLQKQEHLTWAAYQLALAGLDGVHEGARSHLISTLATHMVKQQVEGHPLPIARFKVGGVLIPGGGPDGLATTEEIIALSRQGKGPFGKGGAHGDLSYCFISAGQGSGGAQAAAAASAPGAGKNWHRMTAAEQTEFVRKNGAQAARELIDTSEKPAAAAN